MEAYFRRVLAFARARVRREDAAQDLVQDVFLACLRFLRRGPLRQEERLDAFVLSTARNLAYQHFRNTRLRRREVDLGDNHPAPDFLPQLEIQERKGLVASALRQMEPADQQVLRLSLVEGWKPGQIADHLGLPAEVVRQRKSRALRRISEILRTSRSRAASEGDIQVREPQ
ncbi:MAG: sigma-70 family RNA polymerase sigma factor [Candidatus Solibacter usitatus]|nr:sigma-70 family RNA polymerase sigma factor [Candidatus Solibacter usitatus]